ncbi:serine hydrolase [Rhodococcus triatomae]|uniref:CubicO group peptidase, beta-lactamase class C family n=1 Tax=Rhodococcus triatomae TaxID=300028 RepID=A0A1G8KQ24_9NOCA|nr:serine hydrolase [Rhodococcus triatomae]QNG18979.1 serine hydrolase [Rhodococcus triatomae]QNG25108.1 serine hydrolase [Rhodococcus triatomae]SDI44980.1 CubicO group peptidase, beta-lactamase class C family [Rhodococcus triatomae]
MRCGRAVRWAASLALIVVASSGVPAVAGPVADTAACAVPGVGEQFDGRDAESVGMDAAAVDDALALGERSGGYAVQIYRHGCLVGSRGSAEDALLPLFSASKGVTALAVGRAITLGYFDVDDRLGRFFPEADAEHAALTVRQVLTQTTGLRFSWPADVAGLATDQVSQNLNAPFDYAPGSRFQYAQAVLTLLPRVVEVTTGSDFQDFVHSELLSPLGVERDRWVWLRDRSGNTAVNGGMAMRPSDLARIGQLMLNEGSWGDRNLIDPGYLRQLRTPTEANGGYGFLTWLNAGDSYRGVNVPDAHHYPYPVFAGSPRDMYAFSGAFGQFVAVVPSRDLVIVRMGVPTRIDPGNLTGVLTGTSNPDVKEYFRRVAAAVVDVPGEPFVDPYGIEDPRVPLVREPGDLARILDVENVAAILLGVGPYESSRCNVVWCEGRPVQEEVFGAALSALDGLEP